MSDYLIQKMFDLKHHSGYIIKGQFVFSCIKKQHSYDSKQSFDFCPSCGMEIEKTFEKMEGK